MSTIATTALALGSVYALLGAAVALVSVATRTLHLAIGEVLVVGALLQIVLGTGAITGIPPIAAAAVAVAAGALLAAALEPLLFRRLTSPVQRLVALAVAAGLIQAATVSTLGARTYRPAPLFELPTLASLPGGLWAALLVGLPGAAFIAVALRWSRWGRRVRINGASPDAALRSGFSPARLRASALAVSGAAAVVAGLLVAPLTFVGAGQGAGFTVRGVAAALLFGHVGPPLAIVAGLALGTVEALATSTWPGLGGEVAVGLVVVSVLVLRGSDERRDWGRAW